MHPLHTQCSLQHPASRNLWVQYQLRCSLLPSSRHLPWVLPSPACRHGELGISGDPLGRWLLPSPQQLCSKDTELAGDPCLEPSAVGQAEEAQRCGWTLLEGGLWHGALAPSGRAVCSTAMTTVSGL